jgi:transcription initiation factor TFIIF subunit alpha
LLSLSILNNILIIIFQERLKREYRTANKLRDGRVDEDEEEEEEELTGAGKALKKLVKKTEKNEAYDSDDDDKDPYASVSYSTLLRL